MYSSPWIFPRNPVVVIQGSTDVTLPADEELIAVGTMQVTPNAEIPANQLGSPPAGVSTQIKYTIEPITPGANP